MIEVIYRGYAIRYSENSNLWSCLDLEVSAASLTGVKEKIDKFFRAERQANAVTCYLVSERGDYSIDLIEARVIEYIRANKVAVSAHRRMRERVSRAPEALSSLAPNSDEARAAAERARELGLAAREADRAFRAAVAAIPRLQPQDVAELARIEGDES